MAIIAVFTAMVLPSVGAMLLMPARKTAVDQLMNAFEDARIAALSSGATSYVGLATDATSNVPADQYRKYIIFRKSTDDDPPGSPAYIQLTKWQTLPQGVSFKSGTGVLNPSSSAPDATYTGVPLPEGHTGTPSSADLPVVSFTSTGAISYPNSDLHVYLYEGIFANSKDMFTSANRAYLERLTLSHYTGRIQVDVVPNPGT